MRKFLISAVLLLCSLSALADKVYVTEYRQNPLVTYQAAQTPPLANQVVAIGVSTTQSSAFNSNTVLVRVHADAVCSVQIGGTNPTATTSSARFVAGQTEYFVVKPGDKLAVIEND